MSDVEVITGSPRALTRAAYPIVSSQQFDYFESGKEAQEHADELNIEEELSETPLGYTKVPRQYSPQLRDNMERVFKLLSGGNSNPFLHVDRHAITFGYTTSDDAHPVELLAPSHEASCSLRIVASNAIRYSLFPSQEGGIATPLPDGALELPLGRNFVWDAALSDTAIFDENGAIEDLRHREWERTLVAGEEVGDFVTGTLETIRSSADGKDPAIRTGLVGIVAGAMLSDVTVARFRP